MQLLCKPCTRRRGNQLDCNLNLLALPLVKNQRLLIVCYRQPQSIFAPLIHPTYTANMGDQLPSSASPHGPYFGVCYEDLLGRDYRLTDPTDARTTSLEKTSSNFQWRQNKNNNMVNQRKIHFLNSFNINCLIQKLL